MNVEYITGNEGSRRKPLLYVQAISNTRDGRRVVAHFGRSAWFSIDRQIQFSSHQPSPSDADYVLGEFARAAGVDQLVTVKAMLAAAQHRAGNRTTTQGVKPCHT